MSREPIATARVRERALLIGLQRREQDDPEEERKELAALTEVAGADVVAGVWQRRELADPSTYVGRGKLREIVEVARGEGADLIVSNSDLTPAQARSIEQTTAVRVVDRSQLIMDIFATQAKTRQAKMQVELAQLQYALPRLRRLWTHLDRYKGGVGMRGPGERQIETDRRLIQRRIRDLDKQLQRLDERKQRELSGRIGFFGIGLVGYTNAGKSTLLNRLTRSRVVAADRPFSTLDTRTRLWSLGDGLRALLSDTVGFIRDLPHHLVASFRATLAEAATADLLLHVIDGADGAAMHHLDAVDQVLREIEAAEIPRILVINKVDRVSNLMDVGILERRFQPSVRISSVAGLGLEELEEAVCRVLLRRCRALTVQVPAERSGILAQWRSRGVRVTAERSVDGVLEARIDVPPWEIGTVEAVADRGEISVLPVAEC